jgi:tetratricopeptide (TPR) repeat protein
MLRRFTAVLTGLLGLSLTPSGAFAAGVCKLGQIAELPVTMQDMKPMVAARINGVDALFVADSGAFFSMLSPASAAELKLRLRPAPFPLVIKGIGGSMQAQVTTVDHLTIAGVDFPKKWDFVVGGSEVSGATGILGQNILRMADVEYDLANGVIRLMKPEGSCRSTNFVYWGNDQQVYSEIDIDWATPQSPHTTGVASLNGRKIHVMFDTGVALSVLTRHAAGVAGIMPDSPGVTPAGFYRGLGQAYTQTWTAPFQSFKIGQEEIHNTRLRFIDQQDLNGTDMLIGADFFLSHRIYVASSQRKLYFTYNGGPVFNLTTDTNSPRTAAAGADAASAAQPDTGEGEPTTAEGFSRRGSAFTARHDFEHAIADLSRACELAPQEPRYYFERAEAYRDNEQTALANIDIDQVLKLKPDDVPALMWRAARRLQEHDESGAVADLDAVDHAAPQQADLRLDLGTLYRMANQLPLAISQYHLWIAVHGNDVRLYAAYGSLCLARALSGAELDQGIADCNKAVRSTPNSPLALESRALVRMRMGDLDRSIADYDASLKLQPGNAWALYGRGLAETRQQKTAAAAADFAAATALSPRIADEFKKRGLAP